MKAFLSTFILASFVGIAVFGLLGMAGVSRHSHSNSFASCVGSLSRGVSCPINPAESVGFHLNSFKSFSNSTVPQTGEIAIMISLILSLVSANFLIIEKYRFSQTELLSLNQKNLLKIFEISFSPFKKERINWNLLHENSPNFL